MKLFKRHRVAFLIRKRHTKDWVLKACEARLGPGFYDPGHPKQWRRDLHSCLCGERVVPEAANFNTNATIVNKE
jgi:hypothetical protein